MIDPDEPAEPQATNEPHEPNGPETAAPATSPDADDAQSASSAREASPPSPPTPPTPPSPPGPREPSSTSAPPPPPREPRPLARLARYALGLAIGLLGLGATMRSTTGGSGLVRVPADRVAVVLDLVDGTAHTVAQPGWCPYTPGLEEVYLVERAPAEFTMEGLGSNDPRHAPRLAVRAVDGSSYHLDALAVGFQLAPARADEALFRFGVGTAGSNARFDKLRHTARAVLLDEYGRVTAEEATNPAALENARLAVRDRLRDALALDALELTEVTSPKPQFDRTYEKAIGDRKLAEGEASRLESELSLLGLAGEQFQAQEARSTEAILAELEALFAQERIGARNEAQTILALAESKARALRLQAQEDLAGGALEAEAEAEKLGAELDGLADEVAGLEALGATAVREILTERLAKIQVRIEPRPAGSNPSSMNTEIK